MDSRISAVNSLEDPLKFDNYTSKYARARRLDKLEAEVGA